MDYMDILTWLLWVAAIAIVVFALLCGMAMVLASLFTLTGIYDDEPDAEEAERMKQAAILSQLRADMDRRRQERAADARDLRKGGHHAA